MRYRILGAAVVVAVLAAPTAASAQAGTPVEGPEAEIRAVVEGFGRALERGDTAAALSYLHPELVVYEGGYAETLAEYRSHHLGADMAFLGAVEQTTTEERIVVRDEMALYLSEYTMSGTYRGEEIDLHGTETMVLVPTPEGWKIRHIHWSSR